MLLSQNRQDENSSKFLVKSTNYWSTSSETRNSSWYTP